VRRFEKSTTEGAAKPEKIGKAANPLRHAVQPEFRMERR
jgi:hypothetical protein